MYSDYKMVKMFLYNSGISGTRLVVFGAIHGNETCGPDACVRVQNRIKSGELPFLSGSVVFVPVCNPEAFRRGVRYVEKDLNRIFKRTNEPDSYEARLANELCNIIDAHADLLLDVHSTSAPGPTNAFVDYPSGKTLDFVNALRPVYILLDWPRIYASNQHGFIANSTTEYAEQKNIPAVTFECGQHDDPDSVEAAENAIVHALAYAGIVVSKEEPLQRVAPIKVHMHSVEKKFTKNDVFARHWKHFETVLAGEIIATRENGTSIRARRDSFVLFPKHDASVNEEWFYLGEKS